MADKDALVRSYAEALFSVADAEGELDYVGLSTLVGPDGVELSRAGPTEELLVGDVDPTAVEAARTEPFYLRDRRIDLYGR